LTDEKKLVVPVSVNEDVVNEEKDQRPSKDIKASDIIGPDVAMEVVELEVPVSMAEDDIESKIVVESIIEALDPRPVEDRKASDNLGPDVAMEVVKDFRSLIEEKDPRPVEDRKASDNLVPDVKDIGDWFGCTTVPVNVDSSFENLVAEEKRDILLFLQRLLSVMSITMTIVWTWIMAKSFNLYNPLQLYYQRNDSKYVTHSMRMRQFFWSTLLLAR